jgi:hypothetical protein
MDKMDHLMAEKNENNKDSQKGQVPPKKYLKNSSFNDFNMKSQRNRGFLDDVEKENIRF